MKTIKILLSLLIIVMLVGCNNESSKEEPEAKYNEEIYIYNDIEIPVALGSPSLTEEELKNIKVKETKDRINNYADALMYLQKYYKNALPLDTINKMCELLSDDFEEISYINLKFTDTNYLVMVIKTSGLYYPVDVYDNVTNSGEWLRNYQDLQYVSDDLEKTTNNVVKGNRLVSDKGDVVSYDVICLYDSNAPIIYIDLDINKFGNESGYTYNSFQFIDAYGLPKLSDDEIKNLVDEINKGNYEAARTGVSTVLDFVRLMEELGFKSTSINNLVPGDNYRGVDVGNISYNDRDGFMYTISGTESLIVKEGQCTSTASLLNYILSDDYEEVGYVFLRFISRDTGNEDGHAINYIKVDDKYYLVSPSYYLTGDGAWINYPELWEGNNNLSSIMEKVCESNYPNGKGSYNIAFKYDGIYCVGFAGYLNGKTKLLIPTGAEVKANTNCEYSFADPKHPTSQDTVLGVQIKY